MNDVLASLITATAGSPIHTENDHRNNGPAFRGDRFFLSNFYPHPITLDGISYPTSEHAYQAAKAADPADAEFIRSAPDPGEAKRRASAKRLHRIVPRWNEIRVEVMRRVLEAKFADPELRQKLLATGDEPLIEINSWGDTFWGQCPAGVGENWLGRLLMGIRDEAQCREQPLDRTRAAYLARFQNVD